MDKLERYLKDYKKYLRRLNQKYKKLSLDVNSKVKEREKQVKEALEEGIDIGGISKHVVVPKDIRRYKGDWYFEVHLKHKKKDRLFRIEKYVGE